MVVVTWPRRMKSRSWPRFHDRRVTSDASRISTICRKASTSSDVFALELLSGSAICRADFVPPLFFAATCTPSNALTAGRDAGQVLAVAGVDLQNVALVDEQRHVDRVAGLQLGRLGSARDGVAAHARVALGDLEVDRVGQRHADRLAVVEEDRGVDVLLQEVLRLAEL